MPKILVVDDEPEIINILETFLTKQGYQVVTALGGQKALDILSSGQELDLMVLDLKMSGVNGTAVLRGLAELSPKPPVVILSGSIGLRKDINDLRDLGYSEADALYKPIALNILLAKVKEKLSQAEKKE